MTLLEAETEVDIFLSRAIMNHNDGVFILHGHGTGVLKTGVRKVKRGGGEGGGREGRKSGREKG